MKRSRSKEDLTLLVLPTVERTNMDGETCMGREREEGKQEELKEPDKKTRKSTRKRRQQR